MSSLITPRCYCLINPLTALASDSSLLACSPCLQDTPKLLLPRAMSANSGLSDYVNKLHISDSLGNKRAKQSAPTEQLGTPPAQASPAASASRSTQSQLDRLMDQARNCLLPVSPRGPETVIPPAAGGPVLPPGSPASTFGNVPYPTVMLSTSSTMPPRMQRAKWSLDDYVIMEKLYTGYASTVFKAHCLCSGDVVVLKIYTLSAVCDLYKYQIYREVRVHSNLLHENIVHLYAAFQQGEKVIMVQVRGPSLGGWWPGIHGLRLALLSEQGCHRKSLDLIDRTYSGSGPHCVSDESHRS